MLIDDYIEYMQTYREQYGNKCIVFLQVGSFYEMYTISEYNNNDYDIYKIADICGIQTTKKNKSINEISRNNPVMAGFPMHSVSKFTQILLNNNYTIVIIHQGDDNKNVTRSVSEILSPGSNINIYEKKSNYMMVIIYELINNYVIAGISGIDLSTGKTFVYEVGSTKDDPELANDEVFRMINSYNPIELIILGENIDEKAKKKILKNLNMEKLTIAREGFCCLLQFAYEHNADIIKELQVPEILENNNNMIIEFNSAVQLNILGIYQHDKPLMDILNRCVTAFGSRYFKEKLLSPMINIDKINRAYDDIDKMLKDKNFIKIRKYLAKISDLERFKRKLLLNKISPQDWINFNESIQSCIKIYNNIECFDYYKEDNIDILSIINEILKSYDNILDMENSSKYNLQDKNNMGNIFKSGIYEDIDNIVIEKDNIYKHIEKYIENINKLGANDSTSCKIDYIDKDREYFILITKKRYENALKCDNKYMSDFKTKQISSSSSNYKITNKFIEKYSKSISECEDKISELVLKYYNNFIIKFIEKNSENIDILIKYLIRVDISSNNAKNAFDYRYSRPIIEDNSNSEKSSFVNIKNMRHPLIERIQDELDYVGNDIIINKDGILLYGINASGKSSFMKAVGLNIIMAQSGMFVPAENMIYYPYKKIFTRISGMDNIYKGMSSFTVEMTELRNILQRCNKFSLVIGDEICCGTESISGIAIVSAGIDTLINKGTSFIFATHLHELTTMSCIKEHINNDRLHVKHIKINIGTNNEIIYDRIIQDGQGSNMYGLEVCKSLDMPFDFLKKAEMFRKEVTDLDTDLIKNKKSRYNKKKLINICEVCKKSNAIETHHIKYQEMADDNGFIGTSHKNTQHNLVSICKECHYQEQKGIIKINGYKQTSNGITLDYDISR